MSNPSRWEYSRVFSLGIAIILMASYILTSYTNDPPGHTISDVLCYVNNTSCKDVIASDPADDINDGIGLLAVFVAIFTLVITFVGIFSTITSITMMTSREAFFNSIMQIKGSKNRKYLLLNDNKDYCNKLHNYVGDYSESQRKLANYYNIFIGISLLILLGIISAFCWFGSNIFNHLWIIILSYSFFMFFAFIVGTFYVKRSMKNELVAEIQRRTIEKILEELESPETEQEQQDITIQVEETDTGVIVNIAFSNSLLKLELESDGK